MIQRRKAVIYELLLIIGLPILVMALYIIVQPFRFNIVEEEGCTTTIYSYVGYVLDYGPELITSLGCAILAPLTLRTFLRHRKEMNEFLSSRQELTHNKYFRIMVVACLDTLFNLPVTIINVVTSIFQGKDSTLNYPFISWENVHDGAGGRFPGSSLSSIQRTPASVWSTDKWSVFTVKWDEWLYVVHAIVFFSAFGTTPEMRRYYRSAIWFIPERLGYKRRIVSNVVTLSDVAFTSNPDQQTETRATANRRGGSLSYLDTLMQVDMTSLRSAGVAAAGDLEKATSPHADQITTIQADET